MASVWDIFAEICGLISSAARSAARVNWELLAVLAGLAGFWVFAGWVALLAWRELLAWWSL